jgi:hypothetical protein
MSKPIKNVDRRILLPPFEASQIRAINFRVEG